MKRPEEAVRHYERALSINPQDTETLLTLGNIRVKSGDFTKAHECYLSVLEIDSANELAAKMFDALEERERCRRNATPRPWFEWPGLWRTRPDRQGNRESRDPASSPSRRGPGSQRFGEPLCLKNRKGLVHLQGPFNSSPMYRFLETSPTRILRRHETSNVRSTTRTGLSLSSRMTLIRSSDRRLCSTQKQFDTHDASTAGCCPSHQVMPKPKRTSRFCSAWQRNNHRLPILKQPQKMHRFQRAPLGP